MRERKIFTTNLFQHVILCFMHYNITPILGKVIGKNK